MLKGSEGEAQALQNLSALVDGELDAAEAMLVCAQWRGDAAVRSHWHTYHLIGDVMRSDDLASAGDHDADFLRTLRDRLAEQPAVLAPQQGVPAQAGAAALEWSAGPRGSRWAWMAPAAVAAGFVAVVGFAVTQAPSPTGGPLATLAQWNPFGDSQREVAQAVSAQMASSDSTFAAAPAVAEVADATDGQVLRDAQLDRYFAAHKQFGGSSALGVPSGFLRASTVQMPGR